MHGEYKSSFYKNLGRIQLRNTVSKKIQSIPTSTIRIINEKASKMKDVIHLELGEPDFDTPDFIKKAAENALREGFTHYTPFAGIGDLRQAIAHKAKVENKIDADPGQVVVTPGACSALFCAVLSVVDAGEKVLVPDPGWPHYEGCVKMAEGITEFFPLLEKNNFAVDPLDLQEKVDKRTKAIIINSPCNPTGAVQDRKHLEAIAKIAIENDLIVISDEVYEKIIYGDAEHISIASIPGMRERTITLNGFSKTYAMTGWRVGYAIAREGIIDQMSKLVLLTSTCASSIMQKAALAALTGPQDCVRKMVAEYRRRRDFLVKRVNEIEGMSCKMPDGAFYVFPNIKRLGMSSMDCALHILEKARVSTVPGIGFGPIGDAYLRISYSTSMENLEEAMNRIESMLRNQ
jgi:aspartate/methionine/tyrosine aminotransferase